MHPLLGKWGHDKSNALVSSARSDGPKASMHRPCTRWTAPTLKGFISWAVYSLQDSGRKKVLHHSKKGSRSEGASPLACVSINQKSRFRRDERNGKPTIRRPAATRRRLSASDHLQDTYRELFGNTLAQKGPRVRSPSTIRTIVLRPHWGSDIGGDVSRRRHVVA